MSEDEIRAKVNKLAQEHDERQGSLAFEQLSKAHKFRALRPAVLKDVCGLGLLEFFDWAGEDYRKGHAAGNGKYSKPAALKKAVIGLREKLTAHHDASGSGLLKAAEAEDLEKELGVLLLKYRSVLELHEKSHEQFCKDAEGSLLREARGITSNPIPQGTHAKADGVECIDSLGPHALHRDTHPSTPFR